MRLEYNGDLIPRAQEMRKNMTPQEQHLWYGFLCQYPVRFQRQKTIYHYIADFYCEKARLIVELDGKAIDLVVRERFAPSSDPPSRGGMPRGSAGDAGQGGVKEEAQRS